MKDKGELLFVTVKDVERTALVNLNNCSNDRSVKREILQSILDESSHVKDKLQKVYFQLERDGSIKVGDIAEKLKEVQEVEYGKVRERERKGLER